MELYQLNTFIKVAQEGNLTRAAGKLNTSQPSVSSHIKALEEEFDVILFERSKKGMRLTQHGQALLKESKQVVDAAEALTTKARHLKGRISGEVTMGINLQSNALKIPHLFEHCQDAYPELKLKLLQLTSTQVEEKLKSGTLSCGYLLEKTKSEGIATLALGTIEFLVAGPSSWKDKLTGATPEQIASLPWITHAEGCRLNRLAHQKLFLGKNVNSIIEADGETMICLLNLGKGLGFLPKSQAESAESIGKIAIWKENSLELDLCFAYPKSKEKDPITRALLAIHQFIWNLDHSP